MKIAVVILNWNGIKLLEEFLPSVVTHSQQATIYVADNASTDDSVKFLLENYPTVAIIQNKENGGYAKGYNDALGGLEEDLFVLLNNDVAVTENWLTPFLEAFQKDATLVAAQPKILDYKKPEFFEYAGAAGGFIDRLGYPFCRGRLFDTLEKDLGQYDDTCTIFWATGASLVVRSSAFRDADGFDEDLFAHQEEIDLCWRLQAKGGTIRYIPQSKVFHLGAGTLAALNPRKTFYNFRNTLLILLKNAKGSHTYWLLFKRMLLDALAAIQFLALGKPHHVLAIVRAHFSFYWHFGKYIKKRNAVATSLKYWKVESIVWMYFIRKIRTFNRL